jgi:hypothetical protein
MEVQFLAFFTLALNGSDWSTPCPGDFFIWNRALSMLQIRSMLVGVKRWFEHCVEEIEPQVLSCPALDM